jgi:hypothetical protein
MITFHLHASRLSEGFSDMESTCNVVGVIYAPSSEQGEDLEAAAERFFMLLRSNCKAVECGWAIPES